MTEASSVDPAASAVECARDGTPLRDPARPVPKYRPLTAIHHFRELLKDKEDTSHVFRIFEALPHKSFMPRVRELTLSEQGERLRAEEPYLPRTSSAGRSSTTWSSGSPSAAATRTT